MLVRGRDPPSCLSRSSVAVTAVARVRTRIPMLVAGTLVTGRRAGPD